MGLPLESVKYRDTKHDESRGESANNMNKMGVSLIGVPHFETLLSGKLKGTNNLQDLVPTLEKHPCIRTEAQFSGSVTS